MPTGTIPAQTVPIGETATVDLSGYFTDPDGDALTYAAETSDAAVASVSVSGAAVSVTAIAQGTATITVTASDPEGLSARQGFAATVPNRAPEAVSTIPDFELAVGETATVDLSGHFADPDGDALTHAAETSDAAVASVSVSGTAVSVTAIAKGTATITVTASDPDGLSARQDFAATVPNRAPETVSTIPGFEVAAGETTTVDLSGHFTDPDGDALSFAAETSDAAVASVSVSGATVSVSAVAKGTATITVTASDPDGLSARQDFAATVPNRAPEAVQSFPDLKLTPGETATLDLSGYFADPDGDSLVYAAASSDPTRAAVSVFESTLTITGRATGSTTVTVAAWDPDGLSAEQSFAATVPNRAPEAVNTIPGFEVAAGETTTVDLSGHFTDPDGDALTYAAETSDATVASVSVSGAAVSVTAIAKGTATITVTASDPDGLTARQSFAATVPNRAPEAVGALPGIELGLGETTTVDLSGHFADPDGDALSFAAETSDAAVASVSVSGATVSVSAVASGTATITATASDPDGLSAEQSFAATVSNLPPQTVGRIEDRAVFVGVSVTIDAAAYFTDPEGKPLVYDATSSDPAKASVSVTGAIVTVTGQAVGSATITVSATDPGGLSAEQSFGVVVEIRAPSDLVIEAPWAIPDTVAPGGAFKLQMVVSNRGTGTTPSGTTLRFRELDLQRGVATEIGTDPVPQLGAGWSSTHSLEVTASASAGSYYYDACVDAVANESNFDNNCSTHALTVRVITNRPPRTVGSIPDQRLKEGDVISIDVGPYFEDPDGDDLTYTVWTWSSSGTVFTAAVSGSQVTITAEDDGYGVMRVIASDSESPLTAEHLFNVNVDGVFDLDAHYFNVADNYRPQIQKAIDRWREILIDTETEDLYWNPAIKDEDLDCYGIDAVFLKGTWTDDHTTLVTVREVDGPGGIIAQAGPCLLHYAKPVLSAMILDEADIGSLVSYGNLTDVAFHEMAHSLGFFGDHWQRYGLADYPHHSTDPFFKGKLAIAAFDAAGGEDYVGNKVPIGSAFHSHWRKSVFGDEGMAPTFTLGDDMPFSAITLQAMADLGYYKVNVSLADDYRLPGSGQPAPDRDAGDDPGRVVDLSNDVLVGPVRVIGASGIVERVILPPQLRQPHRE